MRFANGWVKIWRIEEEHWLAKDHFARHFWWDLIVMATYKPSRLRSGGKIKELPPGTIITSRSELAERLGVSEKPIRERLKIFENDLMIVQQKSSKGTIITICNWEKYQDPDYQEGPAKVPEKVPEEVPEEVPEAVPLSEERKKERKKEVNASEADAPIVTTKKPKADKEANKETWEAYQKEFVAKYNVEPLRNAQVNSQISRLSQRIPKADIAGVMSAFFADPSFFLLNNRHPIGILLKQAEAYHARFKASQKTVENADEMTDEELLTRDDILTLKPMLKGDKEHYERCRQILRNKRINELKRGVRAVS